MEDATLRAQDDAAAAVAIGPRVSIDDIKAAIAAENYFVVGEALDALSQPAPEPTYLLTICVITLKNGFTVTGESACASSENFNSELGREIAKRHAVEKIWPLMGFALRQRLHEGVEAA